MTEPLDLGALKADLEKALYVDGQAQYEMLKAVHKKHNVDLRVLTSWGELDTIKAYRHGDLAPVLVVTAKLPHDFYTTD